MAFLKKTYLMSIILVMDRKYLSGKEFKKTKKYAFYKMVKEIILNFGIFSVTLCATCYNNSPI